MSVDRPSMPTPISNRVPKTGREARGSFCGFSSRSDECEQDGLEHGISRLGEKLNAKTSGASPRKRHRVETRSAILRAAKAAFAKNGYTGSGMREIAAAVGVHPALVNRYFGTKSQLFAEAIALQLPTRAPLPPDKMSLGLYLSDYFMSPNQDYFGAPLAMIRSFGSQEAVRMMSTEIDSGIMGPLAGWIQGPAAHERAALILSLITGVLTLRNVLGVNLSSLSHGEFRERLASAIDHLASEAQSKCLLQSGTRSRES